MSSNFTSGSPGENVANFPGAPVPPPAPPPPIALYILDRNRRYTRKIENRATFAAVLAPFVDAARNGTSCSRNVSISSCDANGFIA